MPLDGVAGSRPAITAEPLRDPAPPVPELPAVMTFALTEPPWLSRPCAAPPRQNHTP
ncbi:TonB family protein (fragment) [Cupriavidus phytorum]|uniref:TonB family protein n=1 Tax=Cupriavidus taiwanensis TaxID=164546 RepID=A0A975X8G1_9BURK